jgi:uncharacterized protein (TIGR00251 family)
VDGPVLVHVLTKKGAGYGPAERYPSRFHGDELKVAITAPPVDGQANSHLIKYLAKQCKVAKGQVRILRGELGRHKTVAIDAPKQIPAEIAALLDNQG